jgi:hypothetical protein
MKKIKGYLRPKQKEEVTPKDIAEGLLHVPKILKEIEDVQKDIVLVVDRELQKIEDKISEIDDTTEQSIKKIDDKVAEFKETASELIEDIKAIDTIQGNPGKDADHEAIVKDVLSQIPPVDEKSIISRVIAKIPESKASLKVIRETFAIDPMTVIDKILSLKPDKFQLTTAHIKDLDLTIRLLQNHTGTNKGGYIHGGGFNNIYNAGTLVSNGLTGLNFSGSGVNTITKDPITGIITVDISGGGGGGIASINSDTTSAQILDTGTSGTDFAIVDNGTGTHTFNLPTASAANRGALSSADWTTFNGKQNAITGADTRVLFFDGANNPAGDAGFTYNKTTDVATIGGLNLSGQTASRVAIFDGSKNIISADTTTYPSLTELSYVKGVTSAIQTQINNKQPLDTQLTSLAGLSYTGNALKVVRVNAGETDFELATVSGGVSFGADNQIPFVNAGGTDFDYVSTFAYDSGKLGIGTASPIGTLHTVLASASPATTAWTSNQAVFGSASSTGAALGITVGSSVVTLQALAPNTAWQDLTFMGAAGYWYGGGNNIGIHVTSGGNIGIRQPTASEALDVLGRGLFSQGVTINEGGTDSDTRIESDTHTDAFFLDGANGEITLGAYGAGTFVDTPAYALGVLATGEIVEFTPGVGTVSSVSFTGGLISVATATTTPALTVAGTSGGIPYFSSTSTWASSALLAANAIMIGGGAGAAPATTTTGTGVLTALGINVGSAGAFVTNGGALGTPSSGTVTNLTGTASININGTVGATTPTTGVFTTLIAGSTTSLLLGTAGSAVGNIGFRNATSGTITLAPVAGALGTVTLTLPAVTDTVAVLAATQTFTNKTLTAPVINAATLSGDIVLAEGGNVELDSVLSADGTYTGITIDGTAGATLAFGDLIYLAAADSRWELVDADAVGTSGTVLIGLCVLAAASDGSATKILLQGTVRADTAFPALTISAPVYAGETAGDVQTTIPTGADAVIRVVGFALTADSMYFNPSMDSQTTVA